MNLMVSTKAWLMSWGIVLALLLCFFRWGIFPSKDGKNGNPSPFQSGNHGNIMVNTGNIVVNNGKIVVRMVNNVPDNITGMSHIYEWEYL